MLDDVETRLECLRLATVLHENDVPDVTQLIATSESLRDYVVGGKTSLSPGLSPQMGEAIGETFSGYLKNLR